MNVIRKVFGNLPIRFRLFFTYFIVALEDSNSLDQEHPQQGHQMHCVSSLGVKATDMWQRAQWLSGCLRYHWNYYINQAWRTHLCMMLAAGLCSLPVGFWWTRRREKSQTGILRLNEPSVLQTERPLQPKEQHVSAQQKHTKTQEVFIGVRCRFLKQHFWSSSMRFSQLYSNAGRRPHTVWEFMYGTDNSECQAAHAHKGLLMADKTSAS